MVTVDDRTDEQKATHTWLIIGTDSFLSGWGGASGGASYAAWACKTEDRDRVFNWVSSRGDMKRVREALAGDHILTGQHVVGRERPRFTNPEHTQV